LKPFDLMFGCLGNGITVCDRNREEQGDYKKVAHIQTPECTITWYMKRLPDDVRQEIIDFAERENPLRKEVRH